MVVQQDERGSIDQEGIPQYGTAVDGCLGERSLNESIGELFGHQ